MASPATAHADPGSVDTAPPPPVYELRAEVDVPIVAITGTIAAGWFLSSQLAPAYCAPLCDRTKLNALDRTVAGRYSTTWARVSDASIATVFIASAGVLVVDEGWRGGLSDAVVVTESFLTADALSVVSTMSTRRPRPFMYGEDAPLSARTDGNGSLSFFSGHTAGAFAVTTSLFTTLWHRYPGAPLSWIVLGVGIAGSSFVGTSRMLAGQHFPTDVIGGAVVGSSVGFLVPALHKSPVHFFPVTQVAEPLFGSKGPASSPGLLATGVF